MRIANTRNYLRILRNVVIALFGFTYDFWRYFRYSGACIDLGRPSARDFAAAKAYHKIEKSMSFREQRRTSGIDAANAIADKLNSVIRNGKKLTFHEENAVGVVGEFVRSSVKIGRDIPKSLTNFALEHPTLHNTGGVLDFTDSMISNGRLSDPEAFFMSRYTVRDFQNVDVPSVDLQRAVTLALKSPSACNRMSSFVYVLNTREMIDSALSVQNGNRGFGHEIPCLLVICSNVAAFSTGGERYQHWIDGGMFSMSLVLALHALGYGSCCLNWSKTIKDDLNLRKRLDINPEHTILMMLAVGKPAISFKVCASPRVSVSDAMLFCRDRI